LTRERKTWLEQLPARATELAVARRVGAALVFTTMTRRIRLAFYFQSED
jgi:hypothetical protein